MTTVGVHGFSYAPGSKGNDPGPLFASWSRMLNTDVQGFSYYSYPLGLTPTGLNAYWKSFKRGYWNKYVCAFKEAAPEAAVVLAGKLTRWGPYANMIGHSLGARTINLTLQQVLPTTIRRVLFLEGAEIQINIPQMLPPGVEVLNVHSRGDRILEDLGSIFNCQARCGCIGRDGLGRKMDRWWDIAIDDPETQEKVFKARGWSLDGTPEHFSLDLGLDIRDFGGHWRAYCDMDNAPLYRAWLAGDSLSDIL